MDYSKTIILGLIAALLFVPLVVSETSLYLSYPDSICVNQTFTVSVKYFYNGTSLTDGNVTMDYGLDSINLSYDSNFESYRDEFVSDTIQIIPITLVAGHINDTYSNLTEIGEINVVDCIGLNVNLWQEREYDYTEGDDWILQGRNYDKQLDTPYLNDFAYVVARDVDSSVEGLYEYCRIPVSGLQNYGSMLTGLLTPNFTDTLVDLIGGKEVVGCDNYWYRAELIDGTAHFSIPNSSHYAFYLIDGVLSWENAFSPPQVSKSNLFIPLGKIELNATVSNEYEVDIYLTHSELNIWGALLADYFIVFVVLIPILILIGSIIIGAPIRLFILIDLIWIILWILLRLAS